MTKAGQCLGKPTATVVLGNIEVTTHAQAVEFLREVIPPSYLQEQAEENIGRFTGFLRHEREELEIYIDMDEPLDRVNRAVTGQVHDFIEDLEVVDSPSSGCSLESLRQLAVASTEPYSQLSRQFGIVAISHGNSQQR